MVAIGLADAPAAAEETPAPSFMKVAVKVTFAWSNHPSMQHLTHFREMEILDDGSETLATVKDRFAEAEGIVVDMVQFMWFDQTIGRCAREVRETRSKTPAKTFWYPHLLEFELATRASQSILFEYENGSPPPKAGVNRAQSNARCTSVLPSPTHRRYMNVPNPEQEALTLADFNIVYWLKRFPHWHLTATIVEDEPLEPLETVHRTVAMVHKGYEEGDKLDRHINVKKKSKKWNRLVYSAPQPYDNTQEGFEKK